MKKSLPTFLLVVVLVAGFVYAKSHNFFKEKPVDAGKAVLTLKSEDIVGLTWRAGGAEQIELKKNGDAWQMVKPEAYPVLKPGIDGAAEALAALNAKGVVDEKPADLSEFGLDKPKLEVEAALKDGSTRKLLIGNPLPVAGTSYVKLADAPAVYEMDDQTLQSLQKQAVDFVDKTVFPGLNYDLVKSIEIEWKGGKWTLAKSDPAKKAFESSWKLGDKELKPEEGSAILDAVAFLNSDREPKAKSEVPLNGAEFKLTVKQDDNGKETVLSYTGKIDNQLVRIAKDDGQWVYAAGADQIQEIFDKGKK